MTLPLSVQAVRAVSKYTHVETQIISEITNEIHDPCFAYHHHDCVRGYINIIIY